MTEQKPQRRRRIPRLSDKPELGTRRYCTSYRDPADPAGKPGRQRFSADRTESELACHRWVVENYGQAAVAVTQDSEVGKGKRDQSLPVIADAYLHREKQRVRLDEARQRN